MIVAALRPAEWNLPLFLHVAGAMLLVGSLVLVAGALVAAGRSDPPGAAVLTRLGFRALLLGAIPSYLLMRAGAEVVRSEENVGEPAWVNIGYITSDLGLLLVVVAAVLSGLASRRLRRDASSRPALGSIAAGLAVLVLVMYVFAIWAMTAKPS